MPSADSKALNLLFSGVWWYIGLVPRRARFDPKVERSMRRTEKLSMVFSVIHGRVNVQETVCLSPNQIDRCKWRCLPKIIHSSGPLMPLSDKL